jgi:hypothetical protein
MYVPTLPQGPVIDAETGYWTPEYQQFFEQMVSLMQQSLSNEGFVIPAQSQSNVAIIEAGAIIGTLIFNSSTINGGSSDAPNGQLQVKLADGTFHNVVNT